MIKKSLLLALVLPLLFVPAVSASAESAPALSGSASSASPHMMQLSSWQSEILDGAIVGGTQSVTIVNPTASSLKNVTFGLGTPPCECTLTSAALTAGTLDGSVWIIGELAPGATATLDLVYEGDR